MNHPPIVTFYSFKGGAGRTTLMANVAAALAHPEASGLPFAAKKILLWDLDIEAPGLHLLPGLRRDPPPVRGFIEWMKGLPTDGNEPGEATLKSVKKLVHSAPQFANLGILPAFGADYPAAMYLTDWAYWFHQDVTRGAKLLRRIAAQFADYDYIFIDSRTGISDIGGLLTGILPHLTVLVGQYTRQSTRGLNQAWTALKQVNKTPDILELRHPLPDLGLLLVASPVPSDDPLLLNQARQVWDELFEREFSDSSRQEIPFDGKLLYVEKLLAADPYDQGALALAYRAVATHLHERLTQQQAQTGTDLPTKTGKRSTTAQGKAFEREVAELLRALGYEVEEEQRTQSMKIDLTARIRAGHRTLTYWIECKDEAKPLSAEAIDKFGGWLSGDTAKSAGIQGMVVSRNGFSVDARTRGKDHRLELYTLDDLERQIYDFVPYLRTLCRQWEENDLSRYFIEQTLPRHGVGVIDAARAWAQGRGERLWVVLGDFGTGKSTFVKRFGYELARRKLDAVDDLEIPAPIVIDLKQFPNLTTLEDLVAAALSDYGHNERPPVKAILRMVERGRALLLLDSFDEMGLAAAGVDPQHQFAMLAAISRPPGAETRDFDEENRAAGAASPPRHSGDMDEPVAHKKTGKSLETKSEPALPPGARRVLITCRTEFFRNDSELLAPAGNIVADTLLGVYARGMGAGFDQLPMFTPEQIDDYLTRRLGAQQAAKARHFLHGKKSGELLNLAERPVLLDMLVGAFPRLHERETVNMAGLYALYTAKWLDIASNSLRTTREERIQLLEALADYQWRKEGQATHYDELLEWIRKQKTLAFRPRLDHVRVDLEMRSAAFLVRSPDGFYRFSHKSFREYFLARYLLRSARDGVEALRNALAVPAISAPVVQFAVELLAVGENAVESREKMTTGLRELLTCGASGQTGENALRLAAALCRDGNSVINPSAMQELLQNQPLQLPGAQLAGFDLRGAWLAHADLGAANLEGAKLDGAQLGAARLTRAKLTHAGLSNAALHQADLKNALLADADLSGADLSGAELSRANLRFARLLEANLDGAKVDNADFSYARLAGARLAGVNFAADQLRRITAPRAAPQQNSLTWPRAASGLPTPPSLPAYLLAGHLGSINCIAFSPDGSTIATASSDNSARLWDTASGKELRRFDGHGSTVFSIAFSPDGSSIATASDDNSARLWDTASGKELRRFDVHGDPVNCVAFSPDGSSIA
ncbi:MAG: pentapeptide repeat-containing protein, partial [Sulfuricellaceae bacterium]